VALQLGTRLGPYEIQSAIGAGGMGEVYRARDTRLDRTVAIKVLPAHVANDPEVKQRFEREAKTLAALSHPHICPVFDVGQQDGIDFLVMEHLEGETLAQRLTKGALPLEQALRCAIEIADALDKAHRKGIVHRDLKPGNIMLTRSGTKLLDFGLAKLRRPSAVASASMLPTQESPATAQGTILGTLPYMAPEQLEGEEADARTDLFAFGAMLYEMVTGRKAFESKSQASLIAAIIDRDPPPISSVAPVSPPGFDWIVGRCLAKDPEDRWQTARDLLAALRRTADGGIQPAVSSPGVGPGWHRATLVAALTAALVVVAIVAGVVGRNLRPFTSAPVTRFAIVAPGEQNAVTSLLSSMALSRDGARVVYAADGQLYLRNLSEMDVRPVPGTRGALSAAQPVFSPDGQWLLYADVARAAGFSFALKKIRVTGGTPETLLDASSDRPLLDLTWDTEETILYTEPGGIMRIPASGGVPEVLVKPIDGEALGCARLLPGGKWVLFSSTKATGVNRWDSAEILAQSLDSGERRPIWRGGADARYVPTGHIVYAQGNTLFALPFDVGEIRVTGSPVPIVERVVRADGGLSGTANYSVSDTGTLAYVPTNLLPVAPDGVLALVDRNGVEEKLKLPPAQYRGADLSPDGHQLAVDIVASDGGSDIWIYNISGDTALRQLTHGGNGGYPIWTPEGNRITFRSNRTGSGGIYWQAADGSGVAERLTTPEKEGEVHTPESWSPDGRTLSFTKAGSVPQSIWTLSLADGAKPAFFVGGAAGAAVFSPDGRWLAYRENDTAGEQIYIQPFPPTGAGPYRISQNGGAQPLWSADGRELFYRSGLASVSAGRPRLMVVGITTEVGAPRWSDERVLPMKAFQVFPPHRSYDITPDGKKLLLIVVPAGQPEPRDPPPPQINIVLNWSEELKRLAPTQ
jgi:eukaryotic-like serine/threonine-protein kinase